MNKVASLGGIVSGDELNSVKLSKITNLSQSNLWKTLNGKVPMTFAKLVKILSGLDSEEQRMEVVREFLKYTDKEADIRIAMYYLYLSGYTELLHNLVEKEYKQSVTNNYRDIFRVCLDRQTHSLRSGAFLKEIEKLRTKINLNKLGVNILVNSLSIYGYFDLGAYNVLTVLQGMTQEKINEMPRGLEKTLNEAELNIICAYAYLMQDEVYMARELLQNVLEKQEIPRLLKATALSIFAESYIFCEPNKAMHFFELSLSELRKIKNNKSLLKRKLVENTAAFCCIIHNVHVKSEYIHDNAEIALQYIQQNKNDEACEILNQISNRTATQDFYLSIATKDEELRRKAYHRFLKDGNLFYIKIFDILK
ncbi:AimR family lysis-lysogeny pheromone receptor [Bacillus toyonensis]|uniref:AimR family lysis-lysogeny pheromone receptor n=1 Tax=Bacillus toyonensis TaxID=155322 RepID=UPI002E1AE58B|nr:AimR family lysis-lysogeny pheromone receptor [Bacillus toyonensis]